MCTCEPTFRGNLVVYWVAEWFDDCLYTWSDIASFIFGWCSIFIWCICLFPQIWVNYKIKRVDGISGYFILEWVLGDVTNLVGSILTKTLPTQTYQAVCFVAVDIGLIGQWFYYKARARRLGIGSKDSYFGSLSSEYDDFQKVKARMISSVRRLSASPVLSRSGSRHSLNHQLLTIITLCCLTCRVNAYDPSPGCLDTDTLSISLEIVGIILAWLSGMIYFTSRCPQIIKNYQLQSTEGLSFGMFCLTICGNTFYGLSVMLRRPIIDTSFCKKKLPFLIGSVGTYVFDIAIVVQFFLYRKPVSRHSSKDTQDPSWYTPKD